MIRAVQRDRPVRLLIADDNRDFAANLSDLARLHGFETKVVHSLTQARALANDGSFDVAVVDQRLPDGRGIELLSRWRFDQPDLVPIIVTAFASVDSTLAALNQGAFAFVTKDSEPEVLLDALLRAAENAILRRENRRLRRTQEAILAALPDQLLIVDRQLTVQSANRRDPQLCTHDPRTVLPCPLFEFLAPGVVDRLDWNRLIRGVIETGSIELSLTIRTEGDKTRTYSVRATRLGTEIGSDSPAAPRSESENGSNGSFSDAESGHSSPRPSSGESTGESTVESLALVQIVELTDRVELERRLSESEGLATLGRLVAIIAHELRNPITGIRALGQMLRKTLGAEHADAESVDEILSLTDRMNSTLGDILNYARPREWKEEAVPLAEMVTRVTREGRRWPACEGRNLDAMLADDAASLVTIGERERLFSALSNLVENALHACVEGGHVRVVLKRDGDFANIIIEDDGPGIPPDQVKRVFDPFYSTKKGGTGLGLPIVKTTLDRHGGSITIGRSHDLGGASITVRLPLDPARRVV